MHGTQENFEFESNQDLYDNKLTAEVVGEALQRAKPIDAIKYIYTQKQRLQERTTPIHYVLFKYQADLSAQGQKEKALEVTTFLYKNYPAYRLGALAHAWMLDKFGRYEDGLAAIESHKDFRQRSDMWFCYCRLLQKAGRSDETIIDEYIKLLTVFEREHEKDFFGYVDALIHENKVQAADSAYRKFITGFPAH